MSDPTARDQVLHEVCGRPLIGDHDPSRLRRVRL
jgi:hypothetical protein